MIVDSTITYVAILRQVKKNVRTLILDSQNRVQGMSEDLFNDLLLDVTMYRAYKSEFFFDFNVFSKELEEINQILNQISLSDTMGGSRD